jgi:hypothetical protein
MQNIWGAEGWRTAQYADPQPDRTVEALIDRQAQ